MAKINTSVEIKVADVNLIKGLIDVLNSNYEELPEQVKDVLLIMAEGGALEFTWDDVERLSLGNKFEVTPEVKSIRSVNKVMKRIVTADGVFFPDHFCIKWPCGYGIEW